MQYPATRSTETLALLQVWIIVLGPPAWDQPGELIKESGARPYFFLLNPNPQLWGLVVCIFNTFPKELYLYFNSRPTGLMKLFQFK